MNYNDENRKTVADQMKELKQPSFYKPFSCIGILYMSYNLAGFNTESYYAEEFLDQGGGGIWTPAEEAVALASFKFLMSLLSPFILLQAPKKALFVTLSFISAFAIFLGNN